MLLQVMMSKLYKHVVDVYFPHDTTTASGSIASSVEGIILNYTYRPLGLLYFLYTLLFQCIIPFLAFFYIVCHFILFVQACMRKCWV